MSVYLFEMTNRWRRLVMGNLLAGLVIAASGCGVGPTSPTANSPNVPATFLGRCVEVQGSVVVTSRTVRFSVWDSEIIDGDIISLIVNGQTILSEFTLDVPANKKTVTATLTNKGYNYVMLFAHNTGDLFPNTAALSVDDGKSVQQLVISADLATNGAYNVILGDYPVPATPGSICGAS